MTASNYDDPINKRLIQTAVKHRQVSVKIRDGRTFSLNYDKEAGKVFFKPMFPYPAGTSPLIPCGYLDIDKVTDDLWIETP